MSRPLRTRVTAAVVIAVLTYTPLLGSITGTSAGAQTAQNTTTSYLYDANGNLTQVTDPLGNVTTQSPDALNRLAQRQQPAPAAGGARPVIKFDYDGLDQLVKVTDPRNLVTSYTVDGLGNRSALSSPDTGATGRTFDAAGNLKTSTDARGKITSYSYDVLNRVTAIAYASSTPTVFEYDGGTGGAPNTIGRLTRMTDESGQTTYNYDPFGRVISKVQAVGSGGSAVSYTVGDAYGSSGNVTGKQISITYPSGNRVNYGYDAAGRITSLTLNRALPDRTTDTGEPMALLSAIAYSPFGAAQSWNWGNHSDTQPNIYNRTFDLDGRMTSYPLGNPSMGGLVRTVNYDASSRITSFVHSGAGTPTAFDQTFSYDNLDRLASVIASTTTQSYAYDASGNRTQLQIGAVAYANTISASSNRLTSTSGPYPAKTNVIDAAGNLTSDGTISYTYSDRGRLSRATNGSTIVNYLYNALGQRVLKQGTNVASGANHYVYDEQGKLLGEYDAAGGPIQETVYLGGTPVAVLISAPVGSDYVTSVYYIYADHIDTPRVIARSADNVIVWRWDSADPFGVAQPNENPSGGQAFVYSLRFPGQLFDKETNNYYNYYRDYDPQTGRYIQSDPIGLNGGVNTYGYVGGNPLSGTDRLGLACTSAGGKFSCSTPGGPSFGPLPAPPGWPSAINSSQSGYHYYAKPTPAGKCKRGDLWPSLASGPIPWRPNAASQGGTFNNATPPGIQAAMNGGQRSGGPMNPVTSYITTDHNTGNAIVVNVTLPGHLLFPGYTARTIDDSAAGSSMTTYGEGLGALQSDADRAQFIRDAINNVWYTNQENIVEACGCR